MAKRRGLGGGLENLIPAGLPAADVAGVKMPEGQVVQSINITQIEPNKAQARKKFDEDKLNELAESIRQHGVISPILVVKKGDHYEIVAGERRWRAAHKAELKEIPAIVREDLTEQELDEISLIENIQRENLNPIEEARAYKQLIEEYHLKQDEVADRVSKSRTAITNSMRLLKLTEEVQQMLIDEKLTTGHARALIPIEEPSLQISLAEQIFDDNLSVRDTEKLVKNLDRPKKQKKGKNKDHNLETVYRNLEEELTGIVGTKVTVTSGENGAGTVSIEFYNSDDLEKIVDRLRNRV
ncbi:MAG: ParB/RepB/Spo0J family partition protein [Lachnospiraceae bacterium]|nr:ParB/RepB/Spo0J family partition protein [Lachnospiraceae bacterium]MCR5093588.1 ParB/RepB/Spo0J family partition protein [Lachnospiraceae bacterium]